MDFKRKSWGWYLTLIEGTGFKIKILRFKKDGEISYQRHEFRDEIWLFLKGYGNWICCRENEKPDQYYACKGMVKNVKKKRWHWYKALIPTTVIEIQMGQCCEKDIERK